MSFSLLDAQSTFEIPGTLPKLPVETVDADSDLMKFERTLMVMMQTTSERPDRGGLAAGLTTV